MIRNHIIFHGNVQGVGFRYYAVYKAQLLGLTGWVRNLSTGSVEMEVQGQEEKIQRLIRFLNGRQLIEINAMDISEIPVREENSFRERW